MRSELIACGLSAKRLLKSKTGMRGLRHLMPKIAVKPLMIGMGVAQRRLSDAEIKYNVEHGEMTGGAARKIRHAPLKFRM
jgi:hypothetical protein